MKKIIFIGFFVFLAGHAFCQEPLSKDQQKRVKAIHKEVLQEHNSIVKNQNISAQEKKSRIESTRSQRDTKLAAMLSSEQVNAVKAKDPIKWDKTHNQIDKIERAQMNAERDLKLREIDRQSRELSSEQDNIKKSLNDLKRKQKDLADQQKALKQKKKEINAQYK